MKNLILFTLILAPFFLNAQIQSIENFYNKYMEHEKATQINLKGWLLQMASDEEEGEEAEDNIFDKIEQLRILVMEDGNAVSQSDYKKLMKDVQKDNFEQLMKVQDEGTQVDILLREEGGKITNVLLVVFEEDEFVLLSLEGLFDYDDLPELNLDMNGANHLKKIPKKDPRA
jgi:hypothetical protein